MSLWQRARYTLRTLTRHLEHVQAKHSAREADVALTFYVRTIEYAPGRVPGVPPYSEPCLRCSPSERMPVSPRCSTSRFSPGTTFP